MHRCTRETPISDLLTISAPVRNLLTISVATRRQHHADGELSTGKRGWAREFICRSGCRRAAGASAPAPAARPRPLRQSLQPHTKTSDVNETSSTFDVFVGGCVARHSAHNHPAAQGGAAVTLDGRAGAGADARGAAGLGAQADRRGSGCSRGSGAGAQAPGRSAADRHSHSMVPGGLLVTSRTTRLTSGTSLVMRFEIRASVSYGTRVQSAVMASSELTGRSTIGWP